MTIKTKIMFPFIFGVCASMFAQDANIREKITRNYDKESASAFKKELIAKNNSSKEKAIAFATENDLPITGINKDGSLFQLKGIHESGVLIYIRNFNAGSRKTARVNEISSGGELNLNLNGENMLVGVWDGAPALDSHNEFVNSNGISRVTLRNPIPSLGSLNTYRLRLFEEGRFHSTHVTGTIIASGKVSRAKGIAPKAEVLSYDWDNDTQEMLAAAREGLLVSNHSYGISTMDQNGNAILPEFFFGAYIEDALVYDRIAYLNPYYLSVVAAGNDRSDYRVINPSKNGNDLLTGASTAKNSIIVAAVDEVRDYVNTSSVRMSSFSNYGPTNDFRIKPDISAKGVSVYSSAYRNPIAPKPITAAPETHLYAETQGTSMAAPAVTGVVALWQQWAIENTSSGDPYTSATIRGLMAHTADEAGSAPGPDHKFGWGLINAAKGIVIMRDAKNGVAVLEERTLINSSEYSKQFTLKESNDKLTVTLSWTDVEGPDSNDYFDESLMKAALVNDLDVVVYKDGKEFLPWKLNKNFNDLRAIRGTNDVDNIEKIEIEDATAGIYTIKVTHKGTLKSNKQDYSLLISNEKSSNLSIDDILIDEVNNFRIWPNPVNDVLNIALPDASGFEKVFYTVYDLSGKIVVKGTEQIGDAIEVSTTQLSKGVYFIEIESNGVKSTQKFVKK